MFRNLHNSKVCCTFVAEIIKQKNKIMTANIIIILTIMTVIAVIVYIVDYIFTKNRREYFCRARKAIPHINELRQLFINKKITIDEFKIRLKKIYEEYRIYPF